MPRRCSAEQRTRARPASPSSCAIAGGKDGNYRWTDGRFEPNATRHMANIVEWYGLSIDVDDEVRVQEALRGSETEAEAAHRRGATSIWSTT